MKRALSLLLLVIAVVGIYSCEKEDNNTNNNNNSFYFTANMNGTTYNFDNQLLQVGHSLWGNCGGHVPDANSLLLAGSAFLNFYADTDSGVTLTELQGIIGDTLHMDDQVFPSAHVSFDNEDASITYSTILTSNNVAEGWLVVTDVEYQGTSDPGGLFEYDIYEVSGNFSTEVGDYLGDSILGNATGSFHMQMTTALQ